jgi:ribonuclease E
METAADGSATTPEQRAERGERGERSRGERGGRGRGRGERGERTERTDRAPREGENGQNANLDAQAAPQQAFAPVDAALSAPVDAAANAPFNGDEANEQREGGDRQPRGERGERRSRDRYGRDRNRGERGERGDRAPREGDGAVPVQSEQSPPVFETQAAASPVSRPAAPADLHASSAVAPAIEVAAAPAHAQKSSTNGKRTSGMPKVQSYQLPLADMQTVAQTAGLEWVNSDADKIAAVKAQIAAEPKPTHVPREIKRIVLEDFGPLILVETKRDLRNMQLPFETATAAAEQAQQ